MTLHTEPAGIEVSQTIRVESELQRLKEKGFISLTYYDDEDHVQAAIHEALEQEDADRYRHISIEISNTGGDTPVSVWQSVFVDRTRYDIEQAHYGNAFFQQVDDLRDAGYSQVAASRIADQAPVYFVRKKREVAENEVRE